MKYKFGEWSGFGIGGLLLIIYGILFNAPLLQVAGAVVAGWFGGLVVIAAALLLVTKKNAAENKAE